MSGTAPSRIESRLKNMQPERARFMLYMRVLLQHLQQRGDLQTYHTFKYLLRHCAVKSQRQEPGYESLTVVLKQLIPEIVRKEDLQKAREYMGIFVEKKRRERFQQVLNHSRNSEWNAV
jgi:hypothetical protein